MMGPKQSAYPMPSAGALTYMQTLKVKLFTIMQVSYEVMSIFVFEINTENFTRKWEHRDKFSKENILAFDILMVDKHKHLLMQEP